MPAAPRLLVMIAAAALAACEVRAPSPPAAPAPEPRGDWVSAEGVVQLEDHPAPPAPDAKEEERARDFADEARLLFRIAACGSDDPLPPGIDAGVVKAHCDMIRPRMEAYKARYVGVAGPFLGALLPRDVPDKVVYPFGGGDLVTAIMTYPAAREYTTLSLELAGDPRRIRGMDRETLERSLAAFRRELGELLWGEAYSRSETLKKTQRGDIPGELCLLLVGLAIHGFEPVSLRYFTLIPDGSIHYLSAREIAEADHLIAQNRKETWTPPDFAESFANAEIGFQRRGGGDARVHRHLAQNLSDASFARSPALKHLEQKGRVSAMTKAASYLLWNDAFSEIRGYLVRNLAFMVSDSTGVPPSFAREAGLVQETYGTFRGSLLRASAAHNRDFERLWRSQPQRKLPFRYGYLSRREAHLLVTKRP